MYDVSYELRVIISDREENMFSQNADAVAAPIISFWLYGWPITINKNRFCLCIVWRLKRKYARRFHFNKIRKHRTRAHIVQFNVNNGLIVHNMQYHIGNNPRRSFRYNFPRMVIINVRCGSRMMVTMTNRASWMGMSLGMGNRRYKRHECRAKTYHYYCSVGAIWRQWSSHTQQKTSKSI